MRHARRRIVRRATRLAAVGGVILGGAQVTALPEPAMLRSLADDIAELVDLALGHTVIADRFTGTAPLSIQAAQDLGVLGYVARASGLDIDARRDNPFTDLPGFTIATQTTGDVLARFRVRAQEITASIGLVIDLLPELTPGPVIASPPPGDAQIAASGVGIVEGWRGTITHRVELGAEGTLTRVKIVDPSFFTWPALPVALTGAIVPDFPLVNKSFNLSYAGNDL
jgi:Ni,Fe-hydrogenase III large subunit